MVYWETFCSTKSEQKLHCGVAYCANGAVLRNKLNRFCILERSDVLKKFVSALFILLLLGCSNNTIDKERLTILENESNVAYVESQNLLAPMVCLENQQEEQTIKPFIVKFEVNDELKSVVDKDFNTFIDSRNLLNGSDEDVIILLPDGKSFCTGNNLTLIKDVSQNELEKMIAEGDIEVAVTELDGEVISSFTIKEFVIGKPHGSVIKP